MEEEAHPSSFGVLSFPKLKRYPFIAGLPERVFQLANGKALVQFQILLVSFCSITEPLTMAPLSL